MVSASSRSTPTNQVGVAVPRDIATVDFNGDGVVDVAAIYQYTATLSMNDGGGSLIRSAEIVVINNQADVSAFDATGRRRY